MPLTLNRFPEIIAGIEPGVETALVAACIFIEEGSARRAREDSGAMKEGFRHQVYAGFYAKVWNEEEYAIYNEFGTKYMSAQPMMRPAVEETRDKFMEALALAFTI